MPDKDIPDTVGEALSQGLHTFNVMMNEEGAGVVVEQVANIEVDDQRTLWVIGTADKVLAVFHPKHWLSASIAEKE